MIGCGIKDSYYKQLNAYTRNFERIDTLLIVEYAKLIIFSNNIS